MWGHVACVVDTATMGPSTEHPKEKAIVTRLSAIEELAGVDILCSDKTGTLTQNKLTLGDPFCVNGIAAADVILDAALASRAEDKDTIDLAVIGGVKKAQALQGYALVWAFVNDRVKLLAYRIFDPTKAPLLATRAQDLGPEIAARAFELYEKGGRREGRAEQDWLEAERAVRKVHP